MKLATSFFWGLIVLVHAGIAAAQPVEPAPVGPAVPPPATEPVPPPAAVAPAPEPAPAPAPIVLTPAPAPVAVVEAPAEPPPNPKKIDIGTSGGFWQPAGLLQFWLYASHQDMKPAGSTVPVGDEKTMTFRIRRAELRVKGDIIPKTVQFMVMIDPARALELTSQKVAVTGGGGGTVSVAQPQNGGALTILQDYFITFPSDFVDVSVGQYKIPVSMEGFYSSSKLLFPERAPVARKYGDRRDIGIKLEKKIGDHFFYSAGIFNGSGQNTLDSDTDKDLTLRLEGSIEGLTIGAVGYTTAGKRAKSSRDRLEADVRYDAHNVYVLGEYIHAWDTTGGAKAIEGDGTYVEAGYTILDHLQPMVRVGDLEPDKHKSGDHYWHYEAGVNWLLHKWEAKIGLAVAVYDPTNPTPPSNPKRTEGILAVQAGF